MDHNHLDEILRRALSGPAPADVHERIRPHFVQLAERLRTPPGMQAPVREKSALRWWWTGLGVLGTVTAVALMLGFLFTPLRAEIEFTGLIAMKDGTLFSLADPAAGTRSGWIGLRQEFAGFTLSAYDPRGDVLTLTKDGVKTELRLNAPRVGNARLEVHGTITLLAGEKLDIERATLVFDQENSFTLKNGITFRVTPSRLPDGNLLFDASFDRLRADGTVQQLAAPKAVVLPNAAFSIRIGGSPERPESSLGYSFTPVVTESGSGPAGGTTATSN